MDSWIPKKIQVFETHHFVQNENEQFKNPSIIDSKDVLAIIIPVIEYTPSISMVLLPQVPRPPPPPLCLPHVCVNSLSFSFSLFSHLVSSHDSRRATGLTLIKIKCVCVYVCMSFGAFAYTCQCVIPCVCVCVCLTSVQA